MMDPIHAVWFAGALFGALGALQPQYSERQRFGCALGGAVNLFLGLWL